MAQFTVQVVGGQPKVLDTDNFETVKDVKEHMNAGSYTATVNGDPAGDDEGVEAYSFISLAPSVKGA